VLDSPVVQAWQWLDKVALEPQPDSPEQEQWATDYWDNPVRLVLYYNKLHKAYSKLSLTNSVMLM
jgi:hypothetical protein